ncbi:MAG: saccharopine dehydrogenase C-terminal domain-containing protein, partial [Paracoccaceae bacterium]
GWAEAWADVFSEIGTLEGPEGEARLKEMSDAFWAEYAYDEGEPDRVILCVALKAEVDGMPIYDKTYTLDAWGDLRGSAMARLVSVTVSLAVEAMQNHEIQSGVTAAPHDPKLIDQWVNEINPQAQHMQVVDHVGH